MQPWMGHPLLDSAGWLSQQAAEALMLESRRAITFTASGGDQASPGKAILKRTLACEDQSDGLSSGLTLDKLCG